MVPVLIDLETRSACDLKEEGGHNYATHPSTRLLCVSWTADLGETYHVWVPGHASVPLPDEGVTWHFGPDCPLAALVDRTWIAHNAWLFDRLVWTALGLPAPARWWDSYCLALAAGLPGGLDQIGKRLWGEGKQVEGRGALKKHSRATDVEDADPRNVPPGLTRLIASYCVQDVRLLAALWGELCATATPTAVEARVQSVHDRINERGVRLDVAYVKALRDLCDAAVDDAVREIATLTGSELGDVGVLRKRNAVINWLEKFGLSITTKDEKGTVKKTLRREIVEQWLAQYVDAEDEEDEDEEDELPETDPDAGGVKITPASLKLCARVLTLRNAVLRITGKKLTRALASVQADGIVRGLFGYHSAHTGRWGGRRIQVQNLTRPAETVDVWGSTTVVRWMCRRPRAIPDVKARFAPMIERHLTRLRERAAPGKKYTAPTLYDIASSLLRGMFVPSPGHECLMAADYSSIEARALAWLAGEAPLLQTFVDKGCPYSLMAEKLYGRKPKDKKDPIRQVGKVIVLGCGYGLGEVKFALYGAANGIDFDEMGVSAAQCVDAFRTAFPAIAGAVQGEFEGRKWRRGGFWNDLNDAALAACESPGEVQVGRLVFEKRHGHLYLTLPSGRALCYRQVRVVESQTWWGATARSVEYQSPRFKATRMYGGKWAENVVQATCRDPLAEALIRLEQEGLGANLHVHDEAVRSGMYAEFPRFMKAFTTCPAWAKGLPLDAEGGIMPRYAKAPPPHWPKEELWRNGERI